MGATPPVGWCGVARSSPLAPVLRGEGSGVRGLGLLPLTPDPSPPGARGELGSLAALQLLVLLFQGRLAVEQLGEAGLRLVAAQVRPLLFQLGDEAGGA